MLTSLQRGAGPVLGLFGLLTCLLASGLVGSADAQITPLSHAHAHNDYRHDRPLIDALHHGFTSIEADVHLVDGSLLVAHDRSETEPGRTLQRLYLDPLADWIDAHGGTVYGRGAPAESRRSTSESRPPDIGSAGRAGRTSAQAGSSTDGTSTGITLLVDVKSGAQPTYRRLHEVLRSYADILTVYAADTLDQGPVTVIVSGNRARSLMAEQPVRYAAIDGRPPDLTAEDPPPAHLVPLVSAPWSYVSGWRGSGAMPEADRQKMRVLVEKAHAQGRRIRFWATGDRPAVWAAELEAGVDLLNADDLGLLREFLLERRSAADGAEQ